MRWVSAFLTGAQGWSAIDNPSWWVAQVPSGVRPVFSVPILNDSGDTLEAGAAGAYNAHFLSLAQAMVAKGQSSAVFRLGWEFAGGYMPWKAQADPEAFVAYWRQIVDTMRSVPGQHFQFDWNGGGGASWDVTRAYPGSSYVDYITADLYDQNWDATAGYSGNSATPAGYAKAWADYVNGPYGLAWMATFAAAQNKPMGFPEWGLLNRPDGHGGGDNPYFVQQMYNWFATNNVAYEMYFNSDPGEDSQLADFPHSAALYKQLFGAPRPDGASA